MWSCGQDLESDVPSHSDSEQPAPRSLSRLHRSRIPHGGMTLSTRGQGLPQPACPPLPLLLQSPLVCRVAYAGTLPESPFRKAPSQMFSCQ